MDLTKFDLHGLQSLHISYQNVMNDHKKQLKDLEQDDKTPIIIFEALNQKIQFFSQMIAQIEKKIEEINSKKLLFSVEYLFWNFGLTNKSVQIHFLTISNAYKTYGSFVTGVVLFNEDEIPNLLLNVKNAINSDGVIKFKEIVSEEMSKVKKEQLQKDGFLASEISQIYFV